MSSGDMRRGVELLNELSEATGLPDEMIGEELSRLISSAGKSTENVTLDDLREMLGAYLQDVLLEAKDSLQIELDEDALKPDAPAKMHDFKMYSFR